MAKFKLSAFSDEYAKELDSQIEGLVKNKVKMTELRGVDGINVSDLTVMQAMNVKSKLDAFGIGVSAIGSPIGKIKITDPMEPHLDKLKQTCEVAEIMGTRRIRMFSFYIPGTDHAIWRQKVIDQMSAMLQAADGTGVQLCHENEKGIYGDIASRCEEIHKEFPQLRAVFDPANFIQCGQDTKEAWKKLEPYVEYMHIKDATADGSVVPAGKGIGNLPYLLENYKGSVLTLEPHLSVFDGFDKLEASEKTKMGYCYPSSGAAFDAAVNALKELL